jgi:hypothetical protein
MNMTKSSGSTHRRTPINAWQRKPHSKDTVLRRMQHMTRELETLQAELHVELAEPASGKINPFFEDGNAVESLNLFKAELDQFRRILWFYIEEAARKPRATTDQEQQSRRLERVTDLLHAIAPPALSPQSTHEPGWYFDRLNCVIDSYIQEKKPVAAETRTTARPSFKAFS